MARKLERVTWATWGDNDRGILHLDVDEMVEMYEARGERPPARRAIARCALSEVRRGGVSGVIVAHVAGMSRYGVQR